MQEQETVYFTRMGRRLRQTDLNPVLQFLQLTDVINHSKYGID